MKRSTKLLAALLSLLMLCSVLPMSVFAADTHTVRYVLNYNGAPKMESKTVADGETAPYVDGSVRDGWFFSGWSLAKRGDLYDFSMPVTADITLYAQWTQDKASANAAMQWVLAQIANAQKPESAPDEEQYLSDDSPYHFTVDVMGKDTEKALATFYNSFLPKPYEDSTNVSVISSSRDVCGTNKIRFNFHYKKGAELCIMQASEGTGVSIVENLPLQGETLKSGVLSKEYTLAYDTFNNSENRFYCTYKYDGKTYLFVMTFNCYEALWQLVYGENESHTKVFLTALEEKDSVALFFDAPLSNIKFSTVPYNNITVNNHTNTYKSVHPLAAGLNKFVLAFTPNNEEKQTVYVTVQNGESNYVNPYTDIATNNQFYNEITYCKQNGYMYGISTDTFAPNDKITNETLAVVLFRLAGSPEIMGDSESEKAIAWAKANNLFYSAEADAKNDVTRYDLAHTLLAFVKLQYPTFVYQIDTMRGSPYNATDMYMLEDTVKNTACFALSSGALDAFVDEEGHLLFEPNVLIKRAELARTVAVLKQYILYELAKHPNYMDLY